MATLFCVSNPISHPFAFASLRAPPIPNFPAALQFAADSRKGRGSAMAARAGPSTTSIAFSIALPLSLLGVTVLAASRMADKLDQQWLEEMAKNEASMEVDDEEDGEDNYEDEEDNGNEDDVKTYVEEEPALPQTRNRPKREA